MMDVTVHHTAIGRAHVEIDLGAGHTLLVTAAHSTDRYRDVALQWTLPRGHGGDDGETVQERKRRQQRMRLDLRSGKVDKPSSVAELQAEIVRLRGEIEYLTTGNDPAPI